MKKRFCVALLLCCAVGCQKGGGAPQGGKQELRINIHSEPTSLDPRKVGDLPALLVIQMFFEGLMSLGPEGEVLPGVAEQVEISEDKTVYTFRLREAFWSDGHPLTAFDFEKSWKTMLDPAFPCAFADNLYPIVNAEAVKNKKVPKEALGVHALDARTLEVTLKHPTPYFLELTARSLYPAPSHIAEIDPGWAQEEGAHYVCNGPFAMRKWRHHDSIVVGKNPYYWDKENVKLEQISVLMIEDENTELTLFERGELDWAGSPFSGLPIDAIRSLSKRGVVATYPISGVYYYLFNTKVPPFDNVHMRRAFALAINRREIVDNVTQSGQLPATSLVPPTITPNSPSYFKDADLEEARRLFAVALEEMQVRKEDLPPIHLTYNTMSGHHKIAQAIQEQWLKAFGVRVLLENKEWKVFLDQLRSHQFQVARMGGAAHINDPISFLDSYRYLSSSGNYTQWTHPHFTELVEEAERNADPAGRAELLARAEELCIQEMPIAPIYFYTGSYLKKSYVKGFVPSPKNDINLKYAYIEKE